jgi:peptidoglycan-associated lipoprotein
MRSFLSLIILCLGFVVLQAQPINKSSTNQLLSFGTELYESGDYINAIEKLKEYVKEERDDLEAQYMIADASYKIKDYKYAAKRYGLLIKKDKGQGTYSKDLFNYGTALKQLGEYEKAIPVFEQYIEYTEDKRLKELAEIELAGALEAVDMLETLGLTVQRLESSDINSKQSEYSPTYYKDGETVYFASFAENKLIVLDGTEDEDYHLKIYKSKKGEKGKWQKPEALGMEINRPEFHTGNVKFSTDGESMYFTRAEIDPSTNAVTSSKIYVSYGSDGSWSPPQEVQGVNGAYLAKHPAPGELFGREVLYFSSDMEGGDGGFDIYYATKKGDGVYAEPVPLIGINTLGDEETPFYKDGNLYFSTNGLPGMGGSDIYYTTWNGTKWSKPINMGKGYNSPLDDLFFSLSPDGYSGFLTSNRPGTSSVESSTCCNDIYEVLLTKVEASLITGAFTEDKKPIDSTDFQLIEMTNNKPGNSDLKNSDKTNKVTYALELDKAYIVIANKEGYFPDTIEFNTVDLDETKEFAKVLYLKKKPEPVKPKEPDYETITINEAIELKNILYDFDDDKILPDAEQDLIVLRDLMMQYPEMKIQLNSHTDAQGKDKYNQELSQRRAASAKRWLIKNGVEVTRIKAVGKGETEIRNECVNGVKCDDDQHRYNRRTEFVILEGPTTIQVKKRQFIKKN